tara:strand:+ start:3563 stop:4573 length:1011 start_codon:yes stop_codon:yes gene_type:complete
MDSDQTQKPKVLKELQQKYTDRSTTVAWLNRQTRAVAEERMLDIITHNMQAAYNLVDYVGDLVPERRMVRLSSSLVPMATEPSWRYIIEDSTNAKLLEEGFAKIGEVARAKDVRLSFHPGQFTVLASETPDIVERSIDEFEYHVNMARWMGFGKEFQDFKINVHISGRKGWQGIVDILPRLSPEARNTITIENDEMCHGLDASLMLKDHLALVMDIHHHWIRDEEYIQPDDDRVKMVIDSWRGVRPAMHYSYSRDEWLDQSSTINNDNRHSDLQHLPILLETGGKKQKLRAHSDYYPNEKANDWAISFWDKFDIQCEAKAKNLASEQLWQQATTSL